jgi:hypothetical protein
VRYDERRRTEEMIHVVSAIGRKLQASKQALNTATSENIIEQCKQHLALLTEYRVQLYKLHVGVVTDAPGMGCIADFSGRTWKAANHLVICQSYRHSKLILLYR